MAVIVGKKYMYKTKNKAATAIIVSMGVRLSSYDAYGASVPRVYPKTGSRNIAMHPVHKKNE
jgi:hypothetical protein